MKKILAHLSDNIAGFRQPCIDLGHEWVWWEDGVPAFDAFDRHKPDIAFIDHSMIDAATMKRLSEYEPRLPLVIAQTIGDDLCFHYSTEALPKAFNGVAVPAAVDTAAFYPVDMLVKGEYPRWMSVICEEKECEALKPFLFPVGKYDIRIYGPYWANTAQYIGNVTMDELRGLYSSCLMSYAANAKEAVRIVACGGVAVSLNESVAVLGEGFVVEPNRLKMLLECDYADHKMIEQQKAAVLPKLTYRHILDQLKEKGLEL